MGADTVIPPLPPGFQLESSSTSTLPPLPPGFQLEQGAQGNVPLTSLTGLGDSNIPAFTQGKPPSLLDKIGQLLHPQPDALAVPPADVGIAGPHLAGLFRPPSAIGQMKPGIGKALGEQLTLPNIALLGAGGPAIHAMLQSPLGKAVLAVISAKFAQKGAEEAGTAFGKASTEPAGGQRRYDITQGAIGAAQTLPVLGAPFYRETPEVSGLNREDVTSPRVFQQPAPPAPPPRFQVDPQGNVRDTTTMTEAERQAEATGRRESPTGAEVRQSQGETPIVGQGLTSTTGRYPIIYDPSRPNIFAPIVERANQASGEPKQGGQISFESPAGAKSIPNARQSAVGDIMPAVKTGKGLLVAKPNEITHADVLKDNGINPDLIPHEDPRRGFVDTKTGQFLTRSEAEKVTGIQGTAKAGGLDSMDLPRANHRKFERQDYSTEDLERYKTLRQGTIPESAQQISSPEFQENWKQFEQLRNKYGGMPPKQLEQESELQSNENKSQQKTPVQRSENEHGEASHDQSVAQSGGESQQEAVPERAQPEQQSGLSESGDVTYPIGQGPQALHSGLPLPDWDGRKFVSQAEKVLRDPKLIGFAGEGQVDSQQLKNRLRNKLGEGSGEWKMLQDLGVDKFLDSGKKTPKEAADWVKENGPKVEVRKFGVGAGKKNSADLAVDNMLQKQHELETLISGGYNHNDDGTIRVSGETLEYMQRRPNEAITIQRKLNEYNEAVAELKRNQAMGIQRSEVNQSHWQSIAPKSERDMPGYVEIAVVKPISKEQASKGRKDYQQRQGFDEEEMQDADENARGGAGMLGHYGAQFPSSHDFPPNTLGFVRGYMETLPNGKKVFHVIEVQKDTIVNNHDGTYQVAGHPEFGTKLTRSQADAFATKIEPLNAHSERLAIKAAIDHAHSEGADAIAISDAETAMMTEGHDRISSLVTPVKPQELYESLVEKNKESINELSRWFGKDWKNGKYVDFQNRYYRVDNPKLNADSKIEVAKALQPYAEKQGNYIPQTAGMRLHYDRILPKIAGELTGEKGENVGFGEHKMAVEQPGYPRKDFIFRTPSGQPKTDITARMFNIAKPAKRLASGEPFSTTGRLYGGIPFLDPEFWKSSIKGFGTWEKKSGKDKDPSTRPLGWNPTWDLSSKEREKQILENPTATKLEDDPQFRSQPGEKGSVMQAVNNKVTAAMNTLKKGDKVVLPRDVILDMIDGGKGTYDGPVSRLFGWTIDDAYNREEILFGRIADKLKPLQKGFTKQNRERVGVYAIAQQKGGVQRLLDSGVKQGTIDHILKSFTPKEKAWYDQYRKISEEIFPYVQRLAKELYNINLHYVENHFPFMRDYQLVAPELPEMVKPGEEGATPEDVVSMRELMADYAVAEKGTKTQQGFLITRQPNAKTAIQYDAVAVAHRFLRDVSHFITTQKLLKENGEIARSPKFREKYGQYGQQLVVDWMNTVAMQGRFKRQNQVLQWLRRKSSVGILAFRVASNLVHTANIPLAIQRTGGVGNWRRGLDAALSDEGQAFLNKHFKETFARGGGEPALVEATKGPITRAGFAVERVIDRLNAQATVLGVYQKLLKEKGLNPEEYATLPMDKDAIALARVLARRAVASPLYKDTPAVLARGSDWTKLFFQFQNTFFDQWSNIRYDLAETGIGEFVKAAAKGEIDRATAQRIATFTAAVTAMLFWETSIRYEVKEGEDRATGHGGQPAGDFWKRLGEDALKRVPGVGQTLAVIQSGESGFPLVDTIRDTAKAGQAAVQADESQEPHKAKLAAVKAATGIGEILGVPGTSQASEILQDYMTSSPGLADRSQMYQAARKWMSANGKRPDQPGLESQYLDLNDALAKGNMNEAQAAYKDLQGKVKVDQIKHYYQEYPERKFTGNTTNETAFYASLTPEQKQIYDRTKQGNEEVQKRFFELVGEKVPEKVPEKKKEERSLKPRRKLNLFK